MDTNPAVSVVIRNFNRSQSIGRAIDSVFAQTWQDFEILVVDDASTDDSVAEINSQFGHSARLKIIQHVSNRGAAAAANTGIKAASGRYVAYLDSDDEWLPDFLRSHVGLLQSNPRTVITYCSFFQVWEQYRMERLVRAHRSANQRLDMLLGGFIYSQSMTVARRDALLDFGGFDEDLKISHDYALWSKLALELENPFAFVDRPLLRYRMSDDALTTDYGRWVNEYMEAMDRAFGHRNAAPYRSRKNEAKNKMRAAVIARGQVEKWLKRTSEKPVSVVIRTRNRRDCLERAIASVDQQIYENHELIVVNDSSEDDTREWLDNQVRDDFKPVHFDSRRGRAAALNYGTLVAEGDLVTFLDDDDQWLPEYLLAQVRANSFVVSSPAFTFTDYYLREADGKPPTRRFHQRLHQGTDLLFQQLFNVRPHSLSMFAIKRDYLRDIGGANESLEVGEDADLYLRLLAEWCDPRKPAAPQHSPVHIQRPLVVWRRDAGGCDRALMKQQYMDSAGAIFDGFFATDTGKHYRYLKSQLVEHLQTEMNKVYEMHFGL